MPGQTKGGLGVAFGASDTLGGTVMSGPAPLADIIGCDGGGSGGLSGFGGLGEDEGDGGAGVGRGVSGAGGVGSGGNGGCRTGGGGGTTAACRCGKGGCDADAGGSGGGGGREIDADVAPFVLFVGWCVFINFGRVLRRRLAGDFASDVV